MYWELKYKKKKMVFKTVYSLYILLVLEHNWLFFRVIVAKPINLIDRQKNLK